LDRVRESQNRFNNNAGAATRNQKQRPPLQQGESLQQLKSAFD
jgi:hypothetical protein